jgi:NAD(P) transhydrogenase subunit alpha
LGRFVANIFFAFPGAFVVFFAYPGEVKMIIGVVKESYKDEKRVALVPQNVPELVKAGCTVLVEPGAGQEAGYRDEEYRAKGADLGKRRNEILAEADVLLTVRACGANPDAGDKDVALLKKGAFVAGHLDPYAPHKSFAVLAERGAGAFALELLPRITRAQSMDVLSSMANIAGYKAVILAAAALPRIFPMMMTAAGTLVPAKVFVIGAGVAGLQALATARRLGAITSAYDVRAAAKDQVESLGAKFIELKLETAGAEGGGGYAKAMDEDFYRRQRDLMTEVIKVNDVVITTAAVPGKKAPVLITREMAESMAPGSIIVDLAAERGGNCELTRPGETADHRGVTILGPVNLAAGVPFHASQLYSKNIVSFLLSIVKDGLLSIREDDEVVRAALVMRDGIYTADAVKPA